MKTRLAIAIAFVVSIHTPAYAQYICEGECANGMGKLVVKDGPGYMEGMFINGALYQGKAVLPNGDVYEGTFGDYKLVQGIKKYANGKILEGKFKQDVLVEGKITYPDGTSFPVKSKSPQLR